jgi:hypothetical protein
MKKNCTSKSAQVSKGKAFDSKKQHRASHRLWLDVAVGFTVLCFIVYGIWSRVGSHAHSLDCKDVGAVHVVKVHDDVFTPDHMQLKHCDVLKLVNAGQEEYVLAFGIHERHVEYPGFSMQSLKPNEFLEIDTIKPGRFVMHDHLRDKARLSLDITL